MRLKLRLDFCLDEGKEKFEIWIGEKMRRKFWHFCLLKSSFSLFSLNQIKVCKKFLSSLFSFPPSKHRVKVTQASVNVNCNKLIRCGLINIDRNILGLLVLMLVSLSYIMTNLPNKFEQILYAFGFRLRCSLTRSGFNSF